MTTHIQIPNTPSLMHYTGNGSQTVFIYTFPIFQAADLIVSFNGTLQIGNYAVTGAGSTSGGTVIFTTAPADQTRITIERRLPFQRISDFLEGGDLAANALNNELDYLIACLQQVQSDAMPMLRFAKEEEINAATLPGKSLRANKVLGFDGNGEMSVYETTNIYTAPTVTQTGTGAVARALGDKAKEIVSVKDFGAVGDNVTDDTSALQNAINAHKYIYVPPGTYRITNSLEIGDGKILTGSGPSSIIKPSANTFDAVCLIGKASAIAHLVIDGGESSVRVYGKTAPATHNFVQNVTIKNCVIGIELDGYNSTSNKCEYNAFHHVTIEKPTLHGIHITRSGAGSPPNGNSFTAIRVQSLTTNITGSGIYAESAKYMNSFTDCVIDITGTAVACLRAGTEANALQLKNLQTISTNSVPNIQLDLGSVDTAIINLRPASNGAVISDLSGGLYTALNAGTTDKNRLNRTRITDLTTEQQRYSFEAIALASAGNVTVDLSKTHYFVSAASAATGMVLPKAAAGNAGAVVTIKKTDSTINLVTITENTGTGPDGKIFRLGSPNDIVSVISDGSVWRILHSNLMQRNAISVSGTTFYKPDLTHALVLITSNAGNCTVELPPASAATSVGRFVTLKKIDASANNMRITEEGATGPDGAIQTTTTQHAAYTVMSDGTLWRVIAKI